MSADGGVLLRGSVLRVVALFANVAVAFYLMPFVIHAVGDRWYGMWSLIGAIMGYYGYFDFGLSTATQRFMAGAIGKREPDELNRVFATTLVLMSALAVIAILLTAALAIAAPVFLESPDEIHVFRIVILILGVTVLQTFLMAPFNGLISGHLRYDLATGIEIGKLVVRTALIIYFIEAGYSIVALAVITLVVDTAGNIARMLIAVRLNPSVVLSLRAYTPSKIPELFRYGIRTFVYFLSELLRMRLDSVIIAAFINLSAVTLFTIASQLVRYYRDLMTAFIGVLVPLYARYQAADDRETARKAYFFSSKLAALLAVLAAGAAVVLGKPFIMRWMGPAYAEAYALLVLLIVPSAISVAQAPSVAISFGQGAVGALARFSIWEGVLTVVLSIVLVIPFGLKGVAIGMGLPAAAFAFAYVRAGAHLVGSTLRGYLRSVGWVFVAGGLLQVAAWVIVQYMNPQSYLEMVLALVLLYPPQAVILFWTSFSASERSVLWRAARVALGRVAVHPAGNPR